jgi:hypothetical protein
MSRTLEFQLSPKNWDLEINKLWGRYKRMEWNRVSGTKIVENSTAAAGGGARDANLNELFFFSLLLHPKKVGYILAYRIRKNKHNNHNNNNNHNNKSCPN